MDMKYKFEMPAAMLVSRVIGVLPTHDASDGSLGASCVGRTSNGWLTSIANTHLIANS